jgi:hypothetical protein
LDRASTAAGMNSGESDLIRARVVLHLLLAGLLAGIGHAQASPGAAPAPAKPSSPAERVILKVGDTQVTQADFEAHIKDIEPQSDPDKEGAAGKGRRRLGDDYASVLMLSQQAVASNLDSSPEVSRQLAIARMQVLSDAEFASLMRQADPTTEEISKYYSDHLSDYDQVHIRRLFIWKRRGNTEDGQVLSSQAARARALEIRQACATGTSEKNLSADLIKSGEGMLDPETLTFSRGGLSPQMEKVAFALKEGEWSEVEDTAAALLLIQLVTRDGRPLGQVSSFIEKDLQAQKLQAMLDDLKMKAGIWLDEQYFGTAVAPVPGAQRRGSDPPSQLQKSAKKGESNNEDETQK